MTAIATVGTVHLTAGHTLARKYYAVIDRAGYPRRWQGADGETTRECAALVFADRDEAKKIANALGSPWSVSEY